MPPDTDFMSASDIIQSNPHPAFTRVMEAGFELWYQIEDDELTIKATSSGDHIGEADFAEADRTADIQNILVRRNSRQGGMGTAICVLAVKLLGKPLRNIWSDSEITEVARRKGEPDGESFFAFWRRLRVSYPELFVRG